jgi:ribosomal protein L11 methyltransferase
MGNYIELHISNLPPAEQEILIAKLADTGFEGFEQGPDFLKAFISEDHFDDTALKSNPDINSYEMRIERIAQRNWNEEWEKSFEPVLIEKFCAIRAAFHPRVEGVEHEIIITPKMSFGTGHHATTFQVIQLMQQIRFAGKTVLDFGTGTGVLAILAEKLEAATILAIDNDDWSIDNARENIQMNNGKRIVLAKADKLPALQSFDVILANINKHVILQNLSDLAKHLRPGGVLILSGLLKSDLQDITKAALKEQLDIRKHLEKSDWIALLLVNVNSEQNNQ